jgi:hypothetical protein
MVGPEFAAKKEKIPVYWLYDIGIVALRDREYKAIKIREPSTVRGL